MEKKRIGTQSFGQLFGWTMLLIVIWFTIMACNGCRTMIAIGEDISAGSLAVAEYSAEAARERRAELAERKQAELNTVSRGWKRPQ